MFNPLHRLSVSSTTSQLPPVCHHNKHWLCLAKVSHVQATGSPTSSFTDGARSNSRQVIFADTVPLLRASRAGSDVRSSITARDSSTSSRSTGARPSLLSFRPNLAAVTAAQQRVRKHQPDPVLPPPAPTTTLGLFDSSRSLAHIDPGQPWRAALSGWLESVHLVVVVGLCTLVALFLADAHAALAPLSADDAVEAAMIVLLAVLLGELLLSALVHPAFCVRAHFWFDLIGTLALVVDLAMVQRAVTGRPPGVQVGGKS